MRLLVLMAALLLGACGFNEKVDVMFECPSPSGQKIATLYRVSHGDNPTHQEMKLNIRHVDRDFDNGSASFSFTFGYDAVIRWQSEHAMRIEYPLDSVLTHQETVIFGTMKTFSASDTIQITYQKNPSTHGYFIIEQRCFNDE